MVRPVFRLTLLTALLLSFLGAWQAASAAAHPLNNGYSDIRLERNRVSYSLFLPGASVPFLDEDRSGTLTDRELENGRSRLLEYLAAGLVLENESGPMDMELIRAETSERDGVPGALMELAFESSAPASPLMIYYNLLFDDIDPDHLNFATITAGEEMDQYLFEESDRTFEFDSSGKGASHGLPWFYLKLGVKHIGEGTDHLVFLLSLLLAVSSWKEALKLVTAFTAGHSVTQIMAALGWFPMNAVLVEAGIALTICYSAATAPFVNQTGASSRWVTAMLLGLIHGLGFAGALGETGLPPGRMVSSLLAFNLGVEAGQILAVAAVFPLLLLGRRSPSYRWAAAGASACIFLLGLYWFLERIGALPM